MSVVAFVGIGIMGRPMAVNLARAGFDVRAVVRSEAAQQRARQSDLTATFALDEAVDAADVVITMLPDTPDVSAAVDSFLGSLRPGTLFIDMSTIDPGVTRDIHGRVTAAGSTMLDAPVSGGEAGAAEGVLSIMVGGESEDVARARPLLDAMGAVIVHVGPAGAGQVVKAANQLIVAGNIQLVSEATTFLEAHGVDLERALAVIAGGLAGSAVLDRKRSAFLEHDFRPGFRAALHAKDLEIVGRAAGGLVLPVTALVTQLVRALIARGDGDLDHSALLKLAAELNGRVLGGTVGAQGDG